MFNTFLHPQGLPSIQETASVQSKSPEPTISSIAAKSAQHLVEHGAAGMVGGRDSPSTTPSTAKSSRRDSLSDKIVLPAQQPLLPAPPPHHQQPHPLPVVMSSTVQPPLHLPMMRAPANVMENAVNSVVMKNRYVVVVENWDVVFFLLGVNCL